MRKLTLIGQTCYRALLSGGAAGPSVAGPTACAIVVLSSENTCSAWSCTAAKIMCQECVKLNLVQAEVLPSIALRWPHSLCYGGAELGEDLLRMILHSSQRV